MKTGKRGRSVDWTDEVFGELTVTRRLGWTDSFGKLASQGAKLSLWELKCSCGNVIQRNSTNLRSYFNKREAIKRGEGRETWKLHCDDHPSHVMPCKIGDRLGDLEVICFPKNVGQKFSYKTWKGEERETNERLAYKNRWFIGCQCHACGEYSVENPYLETAAHWNTRAKRLEEDPDGLCGCGCMKNVVHGMATNIGGRRAEWAYETWNAAKQRAKRQGLPFDLKPAEIKEMGLPDVCPVLGIPIIRGEGSRSRQDNSPSLDKFIPSKGYVKGNVHIISWRANRMKSDGTPDEWIKIAKWCQMKSVKEKFKEVKS